MLLVRPKVLRVSAILVVVLSSLVLGVPESVAEAAAPENAAPKLGEPKVACRVNGVEILARDVEAEKRKKLPWASFHGSVKPEEQQALRREALETLIADELKYQDAVRRNVEVSKKEVDQALVDVIANYPSKKAFQDRLRSAGIQQSQVEESLRRTLLIARVEEAVADSTPAVSLEEAQRYYAENEALFVVPKQVVARQIFIALPPLERDEADWNAALEKASLAREQILAGEAFETLVEEMSDAPEAERRKGGLLGKIHRGTLDPALEEALWSLPEGGLSKPIRTFRGVYLLRVDRIVPESKMLFEDISEGVQRLLRSKNRERQVNEWFDVLHKGATVEIFDASLRPAATVGDGATGRHVDSE